MQTKQGKNKLNKHLSQSGEIDPHSFEGGDSLSIYFFGFWRKLLDILAAQIKFSVAEIVVFCFAVKRLNAQWLAGRLDGCYYFSGVAKGWTAADTPSSLTHLAGNRSLSAWEVQLIETVKK